MSKDKTMHFCETIEAVTPATEELRHLLDEREIKYCDYYRDLTYFRLIPDVEDDFFTTVEETHTHRLILKVGFKSPKQAVDAIQAIADTLGDTDATHERQGDAGACRPCPFCGWSRIHMRKKTQLRESVTGLTYMRGYDQFDPVSLGYVGQDFREEHCYDYRFGIRFYCGRCKAETRYVWGEWHLPSEDDVETFDDLPHACERFSPDEERATIEKAIAAWNRRVDS